MRAQSQTSLSVSCWLCFLAAAVGGWLTVPAGWSGPCLAPKAGNLSMWGVSPSACTPVQRVAFCKGLACSSQHTHSSAGGTHQGVPAVLNVAAAAAAEDLRPGETASPAGLGCSVGCRHFNQSASLALDWPVHCCPGTHLQTYLPPCSPALQQAALPSSCL